MRSIAVFNNKGGVGKNSLVDHLSWMFRELGLRVVAADLDPQANLSTFFLDDERIEEIWDTSKPTVIWRAIAPLYTGEGSLTGVEFQRPDEVIALVVGDLELSRYEDELSRGWAECNDRKERAFRVVTAFATVIRRVANEFEADVALVDLGPNLGSLNRAALAACDPVVLPLGPDLFSIRGLRNVGPTLRDRRTPWEERRQRAPRGLELPEGGMRPVGYVMMRFAIRLDRPVLASERWMAQAPPVDGQAVLDRPAPDALTIEAHEHCLAQLKDPRSLVPMAPEAKRPTFLLKPADGAIGGHQAAVTDCYRDFQALARKIADRCGLALPPL